VRYVLLWPLYLAIGLWLGGYALKLITAILWLGRKPFRSYASITRLEALRELLGHL